MYFAGTLKKGGGGKAVTAILRIAAPTECHVESATLVAPGRHKLIVTSELLVQVCWTTQSFVLEVALSVFCVLDVFMYAPEAEWEWKLVPVKF